MANKFGFIFLLTLVALLSCESRELEKPSAPDHHPNSTTGPLSQKPQFKDFMFVQTWPPTYCETKPCAQTPGRFTIHGLWPQKTNKKPGTETLTDAILQAHKTALLLYWPDLGYTTFQDSKKFWDKEYNKHGKLCTTKYSPEEYIEKTLKLGKSFETRDWLATKNIVPDASKNYTPSAIVAAIKSHTRFTPNLQCEIKGGKSYLKEIRLCLDDQLKKFINCSGVFGDCGTHVYYPPASAAGSETSEEILQITEDLVNSFEVV